LGIGRRVLDGRAGTVVDGLDDVRGTDTVTEGFGDVLRGAAEALDGLLARGGAAEDFGG
jgi:hypothetical protein